LDSVNGAESKFLWDDEFDGVVRLGQFDSADCCRGATRQHGFFRHQERSAPAPQLVRDFEVSRRADVLEQPPDGWPTKVSGGDQTGFARLRTAEYVGR
jgi:hypothetical protein